MVRVLLFFATILGVQQVIASIKYATVDGVRWAFALRNGAVELGQDCVYTANNTIHALVEIEGEYGSYRERVIRFCCSAEDGHYRCDPTTLHPSVLTCLAGARHFDFM